MKFKNNARKLSGVRTKLETKRADTEYAVEDYAICVKKGSELLEKINTALAELKADGTVDKIINKYIPKDGGVAAE